MFPCVSIANPSGFAQGVPASGGPNVEIVPTGGVACAADDNKRQPATTVGIRKPDQDRFIDWLLV
jgi:hypothetical protein